MDVYSNYSFSVIPGFFYLVVDPLSPSRLTADKNNGAGPAVHLPINPSFDCCVATSGNGLPVIITDCSVALDNAYVANFAGAPIIGFVIDDPKNKKLDGLCLRFYFPYRLSEDSVQLHQAYNGSCNHREQPRSQAIIFAKDAPSFDATDAVFHINTLLGYLPVLQTLF